jgi:glycosyltransferase involved in cell wall biosynthesis
MKILFTRFPLESSYGGAELQTLSLMKGFIERGHAVAFLGSCPVLLEMCRKENILSAELEIGPPPVTKAGAVSFAWRKHGMQKTLESAIDEFGSLDIMCMLSMTEKILLTPHATSKGIKTFWIEHDRIGRWLTSNPWLKSMLRSAELATTVAVSKMTRTEYLRIGWPGEGVVDIVNGIDAKRLEPPPLHPSSMREEDGDRNFFTLGCIARLSADKGVGLLLEAMRENADMNLKIVGKGPEEPRLQRLAHQMNRKARRTQITIEPSVESVGDFYRSIDAFVLPSPDADPCPLAPMEAMWLGVPTILTSACGTAGYLRHGEEAIIVQPKSVPALASAIHSLHNLSLRRCLSEQGQKAAHTLFSLDRMVDEYLNLFGER